MFRDGLLRTIVVLVDRRVLVEPREKLEDVRGEEIVRLGVLTLDRELTTERLLELRVDILGLELRLDVIDPDRLGEVLRVDILGVLLRLDVLGATDRLGLRMTAEREGEREAVTLRLLLPELLLFLELLAAITGPTNKTTKQMMEGTRKDKLSLPFFCFLFFVFTVRYPVD